MQQNDSGSSGFSGRSVRPEPPLLPHRRRWRRAYAAATRRHAGAATEYRWRHPAFKERRDFSARSSTGCLDCETTQEHMRGATYATKTRPMRQIEPTIAVRGGHPDTRHPHPAWGPGHLIQTPPAPPGWAVRRGAADGWRPEGVLGRGAPSATKPSKEARRAVVFGTAGVLERTENGSNGVVLCAQCSPSV